MGEVFSFVEDKKTKPEYLELELRLARHHDLELKRPEEVRVERAHVDVIFVFTVVDPQLAKLRANPHTHKGIRHAYAHVCKISTPKGRVSIAGIQTRYGFQKASLASHRWFEFQMQYDHI